MVTFIIGNRRSASVHSLTRNDETGPDTYEDGKVMPALTKEALLAELTSRKHVKEVSDPHWRAAVQFGLVDPDYD